MPIIINIDVMLAKRKMQSQELAEKLALHKPIFPFKTGKAKAIKLSTLEAILKALDCQPADLLEYIPEK